MRPQIVIDTNVVFSAFYSRTGLSHALLNRLGRGEFDVHLSVSLTLEYEDVVKRDVGQFGIDEETVDDILDYLCRTAKHHKIYYLWRPFLPDAGDDLVLDLAVAARCSHIVTHNLRHFRGVERSFGIKPMSPLQFMRLIGVSI
jgi:predicted nucleic acid-binding protein